MGPNESRAADEKVREVSFLHVVPFLLLALVAACDADSPAAEASDVLLDETVAGPEESEEAAPEALGALASYPRLQDCEPPAALRQRITDLQARLDELRISFTDFHPDVVAAQSALDALIEQALEDCASETF